MKFLNPAPFGNIDNFSSSSKKMTIESYPNEKIVAPYHGVITLSDPSSKTIEIEHNIDGTKYYSKITEVEKFYVNQGHKVMQNDFLGVFGNTPITYSITDDSGNSQNLDYFFNDYGGKKETENKIEKNDKEKKEKTKLNIDLGLSTDKKLPVLYRGMMNIFAAPFSIAGSPFRGNLFKKSKSKDENEKINEDIKRIKTLLK